MGICCGATTISACVVERVNGSTRIVKTMRLSHDADPSNQFPRILRELEVEQVENVAVTGRRFRHRVRLSSISEPLAVEYAIQHILHRDPSLSPGVVVSAGGETFAIYQLDQHHRISSIRTGNKCASGTGEFFLQQIRRLGLSLDDAEKYSVDGEPHPVSGRCSVFCKSDCTHAANVGVSKGKIILGLGKMMAGKILELLEGARSKPVLLVGGTTRNKAFRRYLEREVDSLLVPEEAEFFEALGAACWASSNETRQFPGYSTLLRPGGGGFKALAPLETYSPMVRFVMAPRAAPPAVIDVLPTSPVGKPAIVSVTGKSSIGVAEHNGALPAISDRSAGATGTAVADTVAESAHLPIAPSTNRKSEKTQSCVVGIDVGSTTTKAVILREVDDTILAKEYLRTNGDPVAAAKACYRSLSAQVDCSKLHIRGLGVTGSGRKIVGLHGKTRAVVNEIVAHAKAAVHFDSAVDTIFEIGGQDAKYTYITAGVASDYAMNEACSAGTGSFLEESAKESLSIETDEIAAWAMRGQSPPDFNDQCSAFISSDIKNAQQEGISKADIAAGLVYSICKNYVSRVKGARPVGGKVFMQGGVCYNPAVPLAMAAITGREIIVPPDPGLAGAFGVALETKERLNLKLIKEESFNLPELALRLVEYKKPFVCAGGKEKCDIGCSISRVVLQGKTLPFGGSCNRYENLRTRTGIDAGKHDLSALRQRLVFEDFAPSMEDLPDNAPTVGINRSFLINTYFPLFSTFFHELGMRVLLPPSIDPVGVQSVASPLCFPCEIAHGYFRSLLRIQPDYIFLPHLRGVKVDERAESSQLCPLVQGEPFYLRGTFEKSIPKKTEFLSPLVDLSLRADQQMEGFIQTAREMGLDLNRAKQAFKKALKAQNACFAAMKKLGKEALEEIESDQARIGVVLFGRPYNAYSTVANKGVPQKFASRGVTIIPIDFLELGAEPLYDHMYWAMGQLVLQGASIVRKHPQLFGTYITNFSCGPDSFVIGYFREILGEKPSLTLEMDDHSADAGLETRIEAFLDIVNNYRNRGIEANHGFQRSVYDAGKQPSTGPAQKSIDSGADEEWGFTKAKLEEGSFRIETPDGRLYSLTDDSVRLVLPSMGRYGASCLAAACRGYGVKAVALPPMSEEYLALGKGSTLCKECLPLQLTTGALLDYVNSREDPEEITLYFMPTARGPCRFGQYQVFMRNLIRRYQIPRIALLSLSAEDKYGGLGVTFLIRGWYGTVIADCLQDMHHEMLVIAENPELAIQKLREAHRELVQALEMGPRNVVQTLTKVSEELRNIPRRKNSDSVPRVLLVGEIYVRQEDLARQWIPEYLAERGIVTKIAPVHEWLYYVNWLRRNTKGTKPPTWKERAGNWLTQRIMSRVDRRIKSILTGSGWYRPDFIDMNHLMHLGSSLISTELFGEAILTIAAPLAEVGKKYCGAIAIGPFGCMPNRLSEAVLHGKLDAEHLKDLRKEPLLDRIFEEFEHLPFLSIESDGTTLSHTTTARLETFVLQTLRLHDIMQ